LDLLKAFDTCSHSILLTKLSKLGVNGTALQWFNSYLNNRFQCVEVNNARSNYAKIDCGVFQGSILGPILFLCYINDIYTATDLATFLFANDTSCLAEHKNLHTLITYVNTELQKLAVWFKANKMAVNVNKTNYIIFRTRELSVLTYLTWFLTVMTLTYLTNAPKLFINLTVFMIITLMLSLEITNCSVFILTSTYL
jgi:hypothetical protein